LAGRTEISHLARHCGSFPFRFESQSVSTSAGAAHFVFLGAIL